MRKMAEIIKKYDNILIYMYMMVALSVYIFAVKLNVYDELWNFSFIYKFTNGYKIYGDLNVLITPLFHFIGKVIFLIFGNKYISFRIYNILICSTLFTTIYSLFKKLKIEKLNAFIYTIILFFIVRGNIAAGANYNFLVMIFVIIGIILELNKNSKINSALKGINLFCIFMTKQNIFVYFCISIFILYIMQIKQIKIKDRIRSLFIMGISFFISMALFVVYLNVTNTFSDFISYCFWGMSEFRMNNFHWNVYFIVYIFLIIIEIAISILLLKIKKISKEIKNINYIFMPFQIMMVLYAYPIMNEYHIKLAILIPTILVMFNLHNIFFVEVITELISKKTLNKIFKICILGITLYFMCYNTYLFIEYEKSNLKNHQIEPYTGILIDDDKVKKINNICEYVKENEEAGVETKIISYEADLYMNILKKNNKNMDLPFQGNLGKEGENGLVSEVQNLKEGTKILISKEKFWQESDKLRDMIMNEYKQIGEIEDFYIYER